MSKQPEALRLADSLESYGMPWDSPSSIAAAALRRQHALIAELVEALQDAADQTRHPDYDWPLCLSQQVTAALSKAKEQS